MSDDSPRGRNRVGCLITDARTYPKAPRDIAGYDPFANREGYEYIPELAERPIDFIEQKLVHVKGPLGGKPFLLADWQKDIVRTLFGWVQKGTTENPDELIRRYRNMYFECPRKNGKTCFLACIIIYSFWTDRQEGKEIYSSAADREQAGLTYNIVAEMIRRNPELYESCKVRDSRKTVYKNNNYYKAIPMDRYGSHGYNPTLLANDELHAWQGEKGIDFYEVLQTACGARMSPLTIDATTAGFDRYSVCWRQHTYALRVRDNEIKDPRFLPVVYAAHEDEDWTSPEVWKKANPNYGISLRSDFLEEQCRKAQENPNFENTFRRLHLSQWTTQKDRFITISKWRRLRGNIDNLDGRVCYGGLDISSKKDITAFVLAFPREDGGFDVRGKYFIPEGQIESIEKTDKVPYSQWVREGHVVAIPGPVIDRTYIERQILEDSERYNLTMVGFDPWNAESIRTKLEGEGVVMVERLQGFRYYTEPTKEFDRLIEAGLITHDGDPVLDWQVENVEVLTDANGNIRPVKPENRNSAKKIDGVCAMIMAIGLGVTQPPPVECTADDYIC